MILTLLPLALLAATPAAPSPFNGIWMMDIASIERPPVIATFSLDDGIFSRGTDGPAFAVKADGRVHVLADDDGYVDAVAVTVLTSRRVREVDFRRGRIVYVVTYTVAADRGTMAERVVDFSKPDGKPVPGVTMHVRVGRPEPGSPLNGQWRQSGVTTTRDHLTDRFRLVDNRFSDIGPGGSGYDAVIGGPPVPVRGDAPTATTAVTMPDDRTIVEHAFTDGAPTMTKTMTLLPDGRTIRVVARLTAKGTELVWLLRRQ
ncbi:MAG TPA: hypothetical protein VK980_10295 [Sphingomonas sp.]|nr:hypothetical protein [Sphingomonas sp.]